MNTILSRKGGKSNVLSKFLALVFKTHDFLKGVQIIETAFIKEIRDGT